MGVPCFRDHRGIVRILVEGCRRQTTEDVASEEGVGDGEEEEESGEGDARGRCGDDGGVGCYELEVGVMRWGEVVMEKEGRRGCTFWLSFAR